MLNGGDSGIGYDGIELAHLVSLYAYLKKSVLNFKLEDPVHIVLDSGLFSQLDPLDKELKLLLNKVIHDYVELNRVHILHHLNMYIEQKMKSVKDLADKFERSKSG